MNQTHADPGSAPGSQGSGPAAAPPPPHQDLDRLRRSASDRYIAGVAGGLGRHFGVDPTIIRVLLAVLAFFGGAGVLLYGVCWLFVPEDGEERAPIHVSSEPRKLLILAAVAVAFLLAVGDAFSGFNAGWPIATIAVVIAIVMIARDRRSERASQSPAWSGAALASDGAQPGPAQPAAAPWSDPASATATLPPATAGAQPPAPPVPPAPPAWQPPQPPVIPPRPKRTGVIWFWPTLALIAIGMGVVGIIDADNAVAPAAYPMVAVAITGVMLVVGAIIGRPGGLILLGLASTFALALATVLGGFHLDGRSISVTPRTAAAVQPSYETHNGRIMIDLSEISDPEALAGRELEISLKAGEIEVIVPREINVRIEAEFDFAGGIRVPGYDGGGIQDSVSRYVAGTPSTDDPALDLEIDATVGQITVEQR